ncbi:endonuclease/exonuclease/phosphatase family protein [Bacteroides sp. ET71]|uniref:endonuclease/exonuclease/phosphatase family protein n=1 Tax=Bacteroides sp. ET71 TaxID=2939421 RepID=UPI0020116D14|nr:endonuclease/exonuclease/phosphatase family protein [Bacteroides sp. ET71]MCL1615594.1 endonuclease/exonuclease/phosphatase family protein [Bacteroides sp. ET71]
MKHLGKLVILLLLAANLAVTGLLLATAYSPYLQPTQHPVLSCLGLAFPIFLLLNTACLLGWLIIQQYKCALLPLAGLLLCLPQARTYLPLNLRTERLPEDNLKILSYNIMGFGASSPTDRQNPILTYLQESRADIICLQEYSTGKTSKHPTQKAIDKALAEYPYHRIDAIGKQSGNKVACYSKLPILSARPLKYASASNGTLVYELAWGDDTLLLINNHLESNKLTKEDKVVYEDMLRDPEKDKVESGMRQLVGKLAEAAALRAPQADSIAREIERSPHRDIIVCGDFNDSPISYTHRVIGQELDDAFTHSGRGLGISYNQNKFYFRIDHILTSPSLEAFNCTVDRSIAASDHYPVTCRIARRE